MTTDANRRTKATALLVLASYLCLSLYFAMAAPAHAFSQHHGHDHGKHHHTLICVWLCSAAVGMHSADEPLIEGVVPQSDYVVAVAQPLLHQSSNFCTPIRAPPSLAFSPI